MLLALVRAVLRGAGGRGFQSLTVHGVELARATSAGLTRKGEGTAHSEEPVVLFPEVHIAFRALVR